MGKKYWIFLFFILNISFFFTGCSGKKVEIETTMTINNDYSGTRIMKFSLSKTDYENIFGEDVYALNESCGLSCPKAMTYEFKQENNQYIYEFKISFKSLDDYKEKISSITGKKTKISFEESSALFESGINYHEGFTSKDLMQWLEKVLINGKYFTKETAESFLHAGSNSLTYKKITYTSDSEMINVEKLVRTPLLGIDLLTTFRNGGKYDRKYIFKFSHTALDTNGEQFKNTMASLLPKGVEAVWADNADAITCTVEYLNQNWKNQNKLIKSLFNKDGSRIFVEENNKKNTEYFSFKDKWSETIDISNLVENSENKVLINYYLQSEEGISFTASLPNEKGSYSLTDSDTYGGYKLAYEGEISSWSIECETVKRYSISDILVDTKFSNQNKVERTIEFLLAYVPSEEEKKILQTRLEELVGDKADLSFGTDKESGKFKLEIAQKGTVKRLNEGFKDIFTSTGKFEYDEQGEWVELRHTCTYVDKLDFSGFLNNEESKTTLTYQLTLGLGETIKADSVSSTVNLKNGEQIAKGNTYTCKVSGFSLKLTLSSQRWNVNLLTIFMGIIIFAIFAFMMYVIVCSIKSFLSNKESLDGGREDKEIKLDEDDFSDGLDDVENWMDKMKDKKEEKNG